MWKNWMSNAHSVHLLQKILVIGLTCVLLLSIVGVALASSGGGYDLSWWTVDGGGGTNTGGSYALSGTIGQPDAGSMSGGDYDLQGGFWGGVLDALEEFFLPLIMRD